MLVADYAGPRGTRPGEDIAHLVRHLHRIQDGQGHDGEALAATGHLPRDGGRRARHGGSIKKKTTPGWVVNGGRRHAELQGELIPRGCGTYVHTKKARMTDIPRPSLPSVSPIATYVT